MIAISRKNNSIDLNDKNNMRNDIVKQKIDEEIERLKYQSIKEYFPAISKSQMIKVKYVNGKQVKITDQYGSNSRFLVS